MLFDSEFEAAEPKKLSDISYCVRPWTPTCLPVFESKNTRLGGKAIVFGGHNTGGFAQSPAFAKAVVDTITGKANPIQRLCHPERLSAFYGDLESESVSQVNSFEKVEEKI